MRMSLSRRGFVGTLGATVGENVTKKTDYVIVGADAGSKAARAEALKREILDE